MFCLGCGFVLIHILHFGDSPLVNYGSSAEKHGSQMVFFCEGLCVAGRLGVRPFVDAQLLGAERMPTGTASPIGVRSRRISRSRVDPAILAGTKRQHQFATALNAIAFNHIYIGTTVWETPLDSSNRTTRQPDFPQGGFLFAGRFRKIPIAQRSSFNMVRQERHAMDTMNLRYKPGSMRAP